MICGTNNIVEHYGKRIKILHGCPFEGWPNRAWPFKPFLPKRVGWLCPVKSALKRTPVHDFNSFSIIIYYIISTTYQKIGDLFCPVHISGLLHSVSSKFTLRMSDVFYVYVSFETCDRCHCYHYHCFDLRKNDFVSGLILNGCKKGSLNLLINSIINAMYTV